jgi:hypothetical protein
MWRLRQHRIRPELASTLDNRIVKFFTLAKYKDLVDPHVFVDEKGHVVSSSVWQEVLSYSLPLSKVYKAHATLACISLEPCSDHWDVETRWRLLQESSEIVM